MERKKLQSTIILDLFEASHRGYGYHFAEIQTGTGKTKILLEIASEAVKEGRSVIISTSNNYLAVGFLEEARKFNICEDEIEFIVGKDNYITREIVMNDDFLFSFSLDPNEVEEWFLTHKGKELISLFISDFSLPSEAEELLSIPSESTNRTISNISAKIMDEPKIYVTNHYYLITLFKFANFGTLDGTLVLCDEVHLVNNTAKNMFRNSFSPFRLKYLLFEALKSDKLSKAGRRTINQAITKTDILLANVSAEKKAVEKGDKNKVFYYLEQYKKDIFDPLSKYLATLQKKDGSRIISAAHIEIKEMAAVLGFSRKSNGISDISYSPVKGYPTFSVQIDNPIAMLRKQISRHLFTFIGVSGTICVSTNTSVSDNRWSFERIGLFKYKDPSTDRQMLFNKMVDSVSLAVYPSIFSKEQARYYVAIENKYRVPPSDKHGNIPAGSYERWVENLALLCKETLWGNSVVLMSSFENIALMHDKLVEVGLSEEYEIFHHTPGVGMKRLIAEYKKSVERGAKSLLIGGLGFYTGIDLHRNFLNTLFLGKLPIEPSSYYSKMRVGSYSAQLDMRKNALLTFRQGIGRAIRTPEDKAFIVIADPRIRMAQYKVFEEFLKEYAVEFKRDY